MVGLVWAGSFRPGSVARLFALLFVTPLAVLALAVCSAQAAPPQWVQMTPTASPPARFGDSMAYDAASNQLVLLDSLNGGTWIWDGADWSQAAPAVSPPPTTYAQMAYDPATQQLILFGGTGFTDTWNWTGSTWAKLNPTEEQYEVLFDTLREKALEYEGRTRVHFHEMGLLEELRYRLHNPAALLIVLPNGLVKLINALPFVCGDLRKQSLGEIWANFQRCWQDPRVAEFVEALARDPNATSLLHKWIFL